ncbi:N-acetylneuraminate synthase family protein, partial [bacterium]|nr:N-acetylneuraminate synthase family protein [bacterium]
MLKSEFNLGNCKIGAGAKPFIIAEIGSNFNQSKKIAKNLIEKAANSRVDAVKFQLFRADLLYPDHGPMYDIFKSIQLNPDWISELISFANEHELEFLCSAFDRFSADILETAGVKGYKIASSEATNLPLLYYIASKNKPMIISTGMCDMVDVEEAVSVCNAVGNSTLVLLQCGSMYPLPPELSHLRVMRVF